MRKTQFLVSVLLLALLLPACAPGAAPGPATQQAPAPAAPPTAPAKVAPAAAPSKAAWEVEWGRTVEAAKKEGTLVHLSQIGGMVPRVLSQEMKSKFGIDIEWLSGTSGELAVRVLTERRAGIYSADVGIIAHVTPRSVLKPAGALESLDKVLFLPDLADPQEIKKVWRFGELDWVDKADHNILVFAPYVSVPMMLNTQLVKPGEIKGYRDLLNPKWKGKLLIGDPTISTGAGPSWAQAVGSNIMGWDYLRKLADQEPLLIRDKRQLGEWVAHGKYAAGIAMAAEIITEFVEVGAPVQPLLPEEGTYTVAGSNAITLISRAPHPNAAKLYINWLLSKEGQTTYSKVFGVPSGRLDVPVEGLSRLIIPDAKQQYTKSYSEEMLAGRDDAVSKSQEIFGKLRK